MTTHETQPFGLCYMVLSHYCHKISEFVTLAAPTDGFHIHFKRGKSRRTFCSTKSQCGGRADTLKSFSTMKCRERSYINCTENKDPDIIKFLIQTGITFPLPKGNTSCAWLKSFYLRQGLEPERALQNKVTVNFLSMDHVKKIEQTSVLLHLKLY